MSEIVGFEKFIAGIANDLNTELVIACPVDTGNLKQHIRVEANGNKIVVYMPEYALYLEYGTGIYGPLKRPITPKEAKALKFSIGNKTVFAKSVKGMTPQPFIRPVFFSKFKKIVQQNAELHLQEVEV